MIQLAALIIQLAFRSYRILLFGTKLNPHDNRSVFQQISDMRSRRKHIVNKYKLLRSKLKLPIAEAAYNGKWEIVDLINKKGMFHSHFSYSWKTPQPVPPRRVPNRIISTEMLHMTELIAYGMNDQSSGELVEGAGWVGPDHVLASYGVCQEKLNFIWKCKLEIREEFLAQRHRKRLIVKTLRKQSAGNKEMVKAILEKDIPRCIEICREYGTSIDFETDCGFTALIAASEERVIGPDHVYLHHPDGTPCLGVEFLLDREELRPSINYETETGLTALIHACSLDRYLVAQALIDRGARVNYQNRLKRTAAHYASSIGSANCIRLLIERGGDMHLPDENGTTAMDIAYSKNLAQIIQVISKVTGGNLGSVVYKRGTIETLVSCPLGCKAKIPYEKIVEHAEQCELREISCKACGSVLLYCNLDDHLAQSCPFRKERCSLCGETYVFNEEAIHKANTCIERLIPCPNTCGEMRKTRDMHLHLVHCTWRFVECKLKCNIPDLRLKDSLNHLNYDCPHRRVDCTLKCGRTVMAKDMMYHLKNICPNRPSQCSYCGKNIYQIDKQKHEASCDYLTFPCPNKCGIVITQVTKEAHLSTDCANRFVFCHLNCRLGQVRAIDLARHMKEECENRLIPCPLGCLDVETDSIMLVIQYAVDLHCKYDCPERQMKCRLCSQFLKAKEFDLHCAISCIGRTVNCRIQGCLKKLPFAEVITV